MSLIYWLGTLPIDSLLMLFGAVVVFFVFVLAPLGKLAIYRLKMLRCWWHCEKQHRAHRAARRRSKAATS